MKSFIINVSSVKNPNDQFSFNAVDYQNKEQFLTAAIDAVIKSTGEAKPELRFEYEDGDVFENTGLLTDVDMNENIWEYFTLEYDDMIVMTASFSALYPEETDSLSLSELYTLAEERSLGEHDNQASFGYAYLEANGHMDNLPQIIEENIDIETISKGLMMTHKMLNNWYFSNKEDGGWRFRGS